MLEVPKALITLYKVKILKNVTMDNQQGIFLPSENIRNKIT